MNVDTGQFQAITGRLAELGAEVARLRDRLEHATEAEAIIRRASYPEQMLYGTGQRNSPRHARPRHLRAIDGGKR